VIAWNSTVRRNDPEKVKMKQVPLQQGPEKGFVPTSRLQPVAPTGSNEVKSSTSGDRSLDQ